MNREMQVSDSVLIDVDAETIWAQVADPAQMPRWSSENIGARTQTTSRPLTVGERFDGTNRRGRARWVTQCVVTASDPGHRFAFDVVKIGPRTPRLSGTVASWAYDFESVTGGTRVTETWTDLRKEWPDWVAGAFDRTVTGGQRFADFQRRNIRRTLAVMKVDFESSDRTT